jgi:putative hydrolase of the HAD superfamily
MPVEAVFFDAGNTLIYPHPSVGEVYAAALAKGGIAADGEEMERRFRLSFRDLQSERGDLSPMEWWRRIVRRSFEPFGRLERFDEAFRRLWDYFGRPEAWRIYDDVLPTLDALDARGVRIGLISNWDWRLRPMLAGMGLLRRMRWTVISCEAGAEKPDRAIFRRALGLSGLAPGDLIHVGDSLEDDALGAARAGLQGFWLCRDSAPGPAPEGVRTLRSLAELPGLLDEPAGPTA